MSTRQREGKAKIILPGPRPGTLVLRYKDDLTAFNRQKQSTAEGKGILNNGITCAIFERLSTLMIPNHHIEKLGARTELVHELEMLPIEVIVRNRAAGSLCKRLGLERGAVLPRSLVEFCYKDDDLGDPLISDEHITCFGWALPQELDDIIAYSLRINDYLQGLFAGFNMLFVDMKLEFGRVYDEEGESRILLGDEITPDTCRLWNMRAEESFDKDLFREEKGGLIEAYREIATKLGVPTAVTRE